MAVLEECDSILFDFLIPYFLIIGFCGITCTSHARKECRQFQNHAEFSFSVSVGRRFLLAVSVNVAAYSFCKWLGSVLYCEISIKVNIGLRLCLPLMSLVC